MRKIANVQGQLDWVQPSLLKMHYELLSVNELVATLRFRSSFGSFATAESADGCWTFKRVGFLQVRATIRLCGSDAEIAVFKNNTWNGGGSLMLSSGEEFLVTTNVWQTQLDIQTASGEILVHLNTRGLWQNSAAVEIPPIGRQLPAMPWMVLFLWYFTVMMQTDNSSVIAGI